MEERIVSVRKLTVPSEAKAALNEPPKPLSVEVLMSIRRVVARDVFGPTLRPTFKQRLLEFSSIAAIKAGWAADHWQKMQRKKK